MRRQRQSACFFWKLCGDSQRCMLHTCDASGTLNVCIFPTSFFRRLFSLTISMLASFIHSFIQSFYHVHSCIEIFCVCCFLFSRAHALLSLCEFSPCLYVFMCFLGTLRIASSCVSSLASIGGKRVCFYRCVSVHISSMRKATREVLQLIVVERGTVPLDSLHALSRSCLSPPTLIHLMRSIRSARYAHLAVTFHLFPTQTKTPNARLVARLSSATSRPPR